MRTSSATTKLIGISAGGLRFPGTRNSDTETTTNVADIKDSVVGIHSNEIWLWNILKVKLCDTPFPQTIETG